MRATGPATRTAHTAFHFGESFFNTNASRFGFLAGRDPANPFAPCERRNILPERQHLG